MSRNQLMSQTLVQVMAWCRQASNHYWTNVDPDLSCHMASLCHNELTCQCVCISSTFCFSAFMAFSFRLISWSTCINNWHPLTPHTHDLALFHQILLNRGVVFILPFFFHIILYILFGLNSLNVVRRKFFIWHISTVAMACVHFRG